MRFLLDAHIPRQLANWLKAQGHDVMHTFELPNGNRASDSEINALSLREERVVVTKDRGFVQGVGSKNGPYKVLHVTTGNISNRELDGLFLDHLSWICQALGNHRYVELGKGGVVAHL